MRAREKRGRPRGRRHRGLWLALLAAAVGLLVLWHPAAQQPGVRQPGVRLHSGRPVQRHIVAVDSGHGGQDTGAQGLVAETQVTQETARQLLALLENDPAYTPVRVHADDEQLSPQERVQAAAQANAELFLSIHANRDSSAASYGFECFAVPPGRDWHAESLNFARMICAEMAAAGARIRGTDGVRYAYYRGGAKTMKESTDTTVYGAPTFGVLQQAACPAVLVEQCFLSSAEDLEAWGDEDGCAAAAACYYRAICAYFGTTPCGPSAG